MTGKGVLDGEILYNPLSEIDEHKKRAQEELMAHVEKWPIGKVFQYLGVDMIVKQNSIRETCCDSSRKHYWINTPVLVTDYVDGAGIFQEMDFNGEIIAAMGNSDFFNSVRFKNMKGFENEQHTRNKFRDI